MRLEHLPDRIEVDGQDDDICRDDRIADRQVLRFAAQLTCKFFCFGSRVVGDDNGLAARCQVSSQCRADVSNADNCNIHWKLSSFIRRSVSWRIKLL